MINLIIWIVLIVSAMSVLGVILEAVDDAVIENRIRKGKL